LEAKDGVAVKAIGRRARLTGADVTGVGLSGAASFTITGVELRDGLAIIAGGALGQVHLEAPVTVRL
jgi:hypothetical protein